MSRVFYDFECVDCGKKAEFYIEPEQIKDFEINTRCEKCGGHLKRSWLIGGMIMKGKGYTKRYRG